LTLYTDGCKLYLIKTKEIYTMKNTIREKIESKIGTNYEELFNDFIARNPKSRRAFFALEETKKIARNNGIYYTGLKIEKDKFGKIIAYQHRQAVHGTTYDVI